MVEIATRRMAKNNVQVCLDNKIGIENNPVWLKKIRGMAKTTPLILSGKRDSNSRYARVFFPRTLFLHPLTPLAGGTQGSRVVNSLYPKIRGMAKTTPLILSGKRDSNPRPLAWEANALPTELFPQNLWRKDATTIPRIVCDHKYRHLFVQLYSYLPKIVFST